jgi:hypothetical protein
MNAVRRRFVAATFDPRSLTLRRHSQGLDTFDDCNRDDYRRRDTRLNGIGTARSVAKAYGSAQPGVKTSA